MTIGIKQMGAYIPINCLASLDQKSGLTRRLRRVAGPDEDAVTMAIEAARPMDDLESVQRVVFSTSTPPMLGRENASTVHTSLGLSRRACAYDANGGIRSAVGALLSALASGDETLLLLADIRSGPHGSGELSRGCDGAAAFQLGRGSLRAEFVGHASSSGELTDRWFDQDGNVRTADPRFVASISAQFLDEAWGHAKSEMGIGADLVQSIGICGGGDRARAEALCRQVGIPLDRLVNREFEELGSTGTSHVGLMLAAALEQATPGGLFALVVLAEGADVLIFRKCEGPDGRPGALASQLLNPVEEIDEGRVLAWRGHHAAAPTVRPAPGQFSPQAAWRNEAWKFRAEGSRCGCGTLSVPPQVTCPECGSDGRSVPESLIHCRATVLISTTDHLANAPHAPILVNVVDFDGGGRLVIEATDCSGITSMSGERVCLVLRRTSECENLPNYDWRVRLLRPSDQLGAAS